MPTIKIKSSDPATQGPFVIIEKGDFNPDFHELYDDGSDQGMGDVERAPTMAELLAARDQLIARERQLADLEQSLTEQARANEVEAQRLADERSAAEKAKTASDAADKATKKAADKAAADANKS
ncbi:hypothetical protein ASF61_06815 [Duganella sp. Leaf126]|uniref:hypothetical protein n=1 Tax=Duganella sp. Leaf126 TaxID=1736266 RepID=UPI0006FC1D80|nr:hypothetical protein [Duganella sp. Leaf126]KQQ40458.1 hypothetical protein ASF61_06815 [Duganella sp. Leaf126]